jgi:hypothetical protein
MREYVRKSRRKLHGPLKTPEERSQAARRASMIRWSNPKWSDSNIRREFGRMIGAAKYAD